MPLDNSCSIAAFRENIRTEIRAGKTPEQAAAIARRTLETSCARENKPVPKAVAKERKPKQRTREYLEAALEQAKKMLPGWMYAVIHQAAFPSSGGRAAANRRLSAMEKAWLNKGMSSLSNRELEVLWYKMTVTFAANKRQKKDVAPVLSRAKGVCEEMRKRGLSAPGSLRQALQAEKTEKGFVSGKPEGGMHAHGLDRRNAKTVQDGHHVHLFVVPGTGEHLLTHEDGYHVHEILEDGEYTDGAENSSGRHSHEVALPDGRVIETGFGGEHSHALMVETTGFGGEHGHRLKLPDGTMLSSISVGEYVQRFVETDALVPIAAPCASVITSAINELQALRDQIWQEPELRPVYEVVEEVAKTGKLTDMPSTCWEVQRLAQDGARCTLADMTDPVLMANPGSLQLAVGDIVEVNTEGEVLGFSKCSEPHTFDEAEAIEAYVHEVRKATTRVDFVGPQEAKLLFVSAAPSDLELARREAIIGPDGALFQEKYLAPLGLTKKDVAVGFAIPVKCIDPSDKDIELWRDNLLKSVAIYSNSRVVALGRVAKEALGPLVACALPHPAAIRRHGDKGEVTRKLKALSRRLDINDQKGHDASSPTGSPSQGQPGTTLTDAISELRKDGKTRVTVTKSVPEKQIVYGVILDPYQVDLHTDWIPPAEIESTAHDFLEKSRIIGLRHKGRADAKVVESWVELYPSQKDRELALTNMPHKVFRRKFGNDVIHSGAWVAGVRLNDELWQEHLKGELDAFSIGGFSFKTQVTTDAMPKVEFVDLQPSA